VLRAVGLNIHTSNVSVAVKRYEWGERGEGQAVSATLRGQVLTAPFTKREEGASKIISILAIRNFWTTPNLLGKRGAAKKAHPRHARSQPSSSEPSTSKKTAVRSSKSKDSSMSTRVTHNSSKKKASHENFSSLVKEKPTRSSRNRFRLQISRASRGCDPYWFHR